MKIFKINLILTLLSFFYTTTLMANVDTIKSNNKRSITFSDDGIRFNTIKNVDTTNNKKFSLVYGLVDLGLNMLQDKSNYNIGVNEQTTKYGVQEDWFNLRNGRSWNVNIHLVMLNYRALNNRNFKLNVYTGIGLQIYNFRYNTSLNHHSEPKDKFSIDAVRYTKNKLSLNYLSLPLMVNFNHRLEKNTWLTYGFGASVGYKLNAWTKQKSAIYGKVKNNDLYSFNDFNVNLIGEIGVGPIRLFASYQLTNMYKNIDIIQHPISFGIRLGKI